MSERQDPLVKCVVWDLDGTLLSGTYLESPGQPPPADPVMAEVLRDLAGRGILQAVATRNPPDAVRHAEHAAGHEFAAVQSGWGAKSAAITAIMAELGLAADSVAFVDDDALERAEVSFSLPEVLVLAPQDMAQAVNWPLFSPQVVTDEARRRGELYLQRRTRHEEAKAFGGSRDDFLRYCQTQVTISPASLGDVPRLHELSVRTHQFNSTGAQLSEAELADFLGSPVHQLITVRLADRFGDDGLVGACLIDRDSGSWQVPQLMMSCRAMGRGVIDALLAWLCQAASSAAVTAVGVTCVITPRNVPLRIALTSAGFRAGEDTDSAAGENRTAIYLRTLSQPLPALPDWARWQQEPG